MDGTVQMPRCWMRQLGRMFKSDSSVILSALNSVAALLSRFSFAARSISFFFHVKTECFLHKAVGIHFWGKAVEIPTSQHSAGQRLYCLVVFEKLLFYDQCEPASFCITFARFCGS